MISMFATTNLTQTLKSEAAWAFVFLTLVVVFGSLQAVIKLRTSEYIPIVWRRRVVIVAAIAGAIAFVAVGTLVRWFWSISAAGYVFMVIVFDADKLWHRVRLPRR